MSENISGFGLSIVVVASVTFPAGFTITQFADDTDPLDTPSINIAETSMGLNGDMVIWAKATPIDLSIAVVPNGTDDTNLAILFEANRVAKGKRGAADSITLTAVYPDGKVKVLQQGAIISGSPMKGVASAGRMKTRQYGFRFENQTGTN